MNNITPKQTAGLQAARRNLLNVKDLMLEADIHDSTQSKAIFTAIANAEQIIQNVVVITNATNWTESDLYGGVVVGGEKLIEGERVLK